MSRQADAPYLYAFVRRDLSHTQQAVQACHACIEAARALLLPSDEHPRLVLCGVKSEIQLETVLKRLERLAIPCRPFRDADLDNRLTALATGPVRGHLRRHFRRYQCLRQGGAVESSRALGPRGGEAEAAEQHVDRSRNAFSHTKAINRHE